MKRLLLFLLLIPFFADAQVQTDAQLITQINNTIRGKAFDAKNHANAFKTIVDSKLNLAGGILSGNFILDGQSTFGGSGYNFDLGIDVPGQRLREFNVYLSSGGSLKFNETFLRIDGSARPLQLSSNSLLQIGTNGGALLDFYATGGGNIGLNTSTGAGSVEVRPGTGQFRIYNPANTFYYTIARGAITANRTLTIPLLTGNDVFVTEAFTQTLANKTLTSPVINTQISGTVTSGGNITTTNFLVGATATQTLSGKTLISPILNTPRLNTTSTTGYVWTATDGIGNGSWQAASGGGGIGGSTGSVDNAILRADGTGGSTLQSSPVSISDAGDVSISDGVDNLIVITPNSGFLGYKLGASAASAISFRGAAGIASSIDGQSVSISGGNAYTVSGNGNGGHVFLFGGLPQGTGKAGNTNLNISNGIISNWQNMERGVVIYNRVAAPTAGITDAVALHATDVNSNSELFLTTESGAEVNISGLLTPVLLSGTSLTLSELHRNKIIYCTSGSAVTITVPAGLPLGYNCIIMQDGAGTVTLNVSAVTLKGKSATTGDGDIISLSHYKATDNYLGR